MSSQEAFLSRVRRALHKEPSPMAGRTPLLFPDDWAPEAVEALRERMATQRPRLVTQLQQELAGVGGVVTYVQSAAEVTGYITRLAREKGATLMVRWQSELLQALEVDAALHQYGVTVETASLPSVGVPGDAAYEAALAPKRREMRELLARADLGLSGVDYAIADTGTLALAALPGQMRGVSLLPPVHIAVARTEQIVATMADCLMLLQGTGTEVQHRLTSCISFVTGPSRTGDIELKLTVGVHGPGELHLVIFDDSRAMPAI